MIRTYLLRALLTLKGSRTFKKFGEFKKREYLPLEENLKFQEERLKDILFYSWKNVPYYTKILEEAGAVRDGKVNLKNFHKIPVLTKDIIRKNFEELKSRDLEKISFIKNTSGGSTGEPIFLFQDEAMSSEDIAVAWFQNSFVCEYPCKHLKLWGSERDISKEWDIIGRVKEWLFSVKILNSFKISEQEMEDYVEKINRYKPDLIESYVQSVYELSKFIKKNNLQVYSPKGIITSAGNLYPEMKKLIEEVFKTKVFNRYGSRETPTLACSCKEDKGLHLNIFTKYTEILDDYLKPCKPGEIGEIYITTLNNYSMPLIRYKIEDMAVPSEKKQCSCGRGMPLIEKVVGRNINIFKNFKGEKIDGAYFMVIVFFKDWIKKYQVIQESYNNIIYKIVKKGKPLKKDLEDIEKRVKIVMGKDCKVKFEFVGEIEPTKSGKFLYTISKVK